jgi:pyridoxine 5-phosphate synthase
MVNLSVNVNKVATLRNSRGGTEPRVLDAVDVCLSAGVRGITVHPRADQRHITPTDVRDIAGRLTVWHAGRNRNSASASVGPAAHVEFNLEGDPRADFIELVHEVRPDQCTIVPVIPGEVTSQAGWTRGPETDRLPAVIAAMKARGIRVSLFVDPTAEAIELAQAVGADRVELYTEPFARAFEKGPEAAQASFHRYAAAATEAHSRGLGVNAGHDLDLANLVLFRELPHLDEVSIGHAIISRALFVGLDTVVREYLAVLSTGR